MAIGTPAYLGGAFQAGGATTVITTVANAPAGNLIIVPSFARASPAYSSTTDSASNTYATAANALGGSTRVAWGYAANPALLSSGGSVTVTYTLAISSNGTAQGLSVSGMDLSSPLDVVSAIDANTGTGTSIAVTPGQADELIIGCVTIQLGASGDSFVEAPGFTSLGTVGTSGTRLTYLAYKIVSSTALVTYNPTWTNSRGYVSQVTTWKMAAAASSARVGLLLGVGP